MDSRKVDLGAEQVLVRLKGYVPCSPAIEIEILDVADNALCQLEKPQSGDLDYLFSHAELFMVPVEFVFDNEFKVKGFGCIWPMQGGDEFFFVPDNMAEVLDGGFEGERPGF